MSFFLPYQIRWIQDNSRIKIMEKSRQIGLSWAAAYRTLRNATCQPYSNHWICSRDAKQAQLFLEDCKRFAHILNLPVKQKLLSKKPENRSTLTLNNKSQLTILSSNINAQAGKRGSRILDEFALHASPEELYNIAYPGITWGGQLEIISTHRGAHNFFNQLIEEVRNGHNPKNISLHRVTLTDALEQGFLAKLKSKLPADDPRQAMDEGDYYNFIKNSCATEKSFLQEYMCQPYDDDNAFLSYELLESCFYENTEENPVLGPCFMGVDLARTQDLSAFVVLEKLNGIYFLKIIKCLKNARFDEQELLFKQLFSQYRCQKVCIDRTGIGGQFFERAQTFFGTYCVEGISFTAKTKEQMAYNLKASFERKTIRIPRDEHLIQDLLSIRLNEQQQFQANHNALGHADRFWALALALHADRQSSVAPFAAEFFNINRPSLYEN